MQSMQQLRKLTALACAFLAPAAFATDTAVDTPAYPASLAPACVAMTDCADTLHSAHEVTFISRLSFPSGSALLSRDAKNELLRMLIELESYAVIQHVEIIGHADPSGPENFNRWLSETRAQRVEDFFAQSGVDPRKVSLRGLGSSAPLVGAIDPAEHRRVEVQITLRPFL